MNNMIKDGPLTLTFKSEARMGFTLYSATLNGKELARSIFSLQYMFDGKKRVFFPNHVFSADNKYLAIAEYHPCLFTLRFRYKFSLVLFDLHSGKEAIVSNTIDNGMIDPKKFEDQPPNQKIVYHKHVDGFTREFEYKISTIDNWHSF